MKPQVTIMILTFAVVNSRPQVSAPNLMRTPGYSSTNNDVEQNQDARYSTLAEKYLGDLSQQEIEVRSGVKVKGLYSYNDGFYRRTIRYEADDQGYRVLGEETEPLDEPVTQRNGDMKSEANEALLNSSMQSIQIAKENKVI